MTPIWRKLIWPRQRRRKEDDLREEIQFHLDEEAEERRTEGLTTEAARWAARRDLGNRALVEENTRAEWTWTWLEQLRQDCRYAAGNDLFYTDNNHVSRFGAMKILAAADLNI